MNNSSSVSHLCERLATVTNGCANNIANNTNGGNTATDYNSLQNLASSLLLNHKLPSHNSTRKRHQQQHAMINEHSQCVDQRNLKEMVCQCLDFMEEQQRNISSKDQKIDELQLEIERVIIIILNTPYIFMCGLCIYCS